MTSKRDYLDYLSDIIEYTDAAISFVDGMSLEDFREDKKTIFAVVRALEVIGEATKHIPDSLRSQYPDVPWRSIAGTRDKLIHEYFGVNLVVVWHTVIDDLPSLHSSVDTILKNETS
ncbi:MAG: DUF86 domain-containing protein [Chloroflexota bacterium]